ncbi:MAG: hypothetical protein O3A00_03730, partial [Planctomycetota bacterium]|nr:hypothetical protein [Planctomycetota bacterium]
DEKRSLGEFIAGLEDEPDSKSQPFFSPSKPTRENKDRISYLFANDVYDLPNTLRPSCHRDKQHAYISMYGTVRHRI